MKVNIHNKNSSDISKKKNGSILFIIIAFCIPVLIYLQTIKFGFINLDDNEIISNNITFLSNFGNAPHAFFTDQFINGQSKFYRPLGTLSYMLDIQLSGGNYPWMFHISNILLLGLISCLLFILLKKFFILAKLSLLVSLVYCTHPLFVSTCASLANRAELLLIFFSLLSFLFFIQHLQKGKIIFLILHWIVFTIALFCKETAAFLPFLYIIYFFTFCNKKYTNKKYIINIILYTISGLFWFWIKYKAIKNFSIQSEEFGLTALLSNLRIIPESLTKFFIPYDFAPIPSFSTLKCITGLIIIVIIIILFIKNNERYKKEKIFCLLWFLILMIPSMMYKNPTFDYLDHRFFLPLIGILLFLLLTFPKKFIEKEDIKISYFLVAIFILFCFFTIVKSRSYSNPDDFYNSAVINNSNSVLAYNNRGFIKYKKNDFQGAIEDYNKAISIKPEYSEAYTNRSLVYYSTQQDDKAITDNNKAIELNPKFAKAYYNRGNIYKDLKQYNNAIADFNKTIELDPEISEPYNNRGIIYYDLKLYDKALADYNEAIRLNPEGYETYNNRGWLYLDKNKVDEAISDFKYSISINSNFIIAYKNLAWAYFKLKNYNDAINNYSKVILLSETDAQSFHFRGLSYFKINRTDIACKDWLKAMQLGWADSKEYILKYCK